MAHSQQILDELMSVSELVAALPSHAPYQVPTNYFETLPEVLMARILKLERGEANLLLTNPKQVTPYSIPSGYFDQLSGVILNRVKLEEASCDEELEILAPSLLQARYKNTFTLPAGYLEQFSTSVLNRIKSEEASETDELEVLSPLLSRIQKTIPFKMPDGYFDELPSDITAGISAVDYVNQELESHAPIMNDLKIKNVYRVPEGYFDNFGEGLLGTVKKNRKATVIPFNLSKKVLRYSVAALAAGILSIAALNYYFNKPSNVINEVAEIQRISNDEMIHYLESEPGTLTENTELASATIGDDDVNALFADVPDEELVQYLDHQTASKDL